ncbi:uncharacterized protein TRIADDRAFT_24460, partial [Trichoplax adhaerens]
LEPYQYIVQIPGKEIRVKLIQAFNNWLQIPEDKLAAISSVVQMLHNASLLIDDIEDNSKLRRGVPVAHQIFGLAQTINAANYVYFKAMHEILSLNHPDGVKIFTEEMLELHQGQGLDILWRDSHNCPSEEEYKMMVNKKTGGLFRLAVNLMQLFSENKRNFTPLLNYLSLFFQIGDDYANLQSTQYSKNKSFCEDLTEGKFSFPIIHAAHTETGRNTVLNIVRQRTTDDHVKQFCVELLEKVGSFSYTREILRGLSVQVMEEVKNLGGNEELCQLLQQLSVAFSLG